MKNFKIIIRRKSRKTKYYKTVKFVCYIFLKRKKERVYISAVDSFCVGKIRIKFSDFEVKVNI